MDYKAKAKDSFKTKWTLFCFYSIINERNNFSLLEFRNFKITEDLIETYTTQYHQYHYKETLDKYPTKNIKYIIDEMTKNLSRPEKSTFMKDYIDNFEEILSHEKWQELTEIKECYYCNLKVTDFDLLYKQHKIFNKSGRGFTLELDRKKANFEYTDDNCVMACYWCNNAKTDEFSADEFRPIALAIKQAFINRIK